MTTLTETIHVGEFLLSEADGFYSREQVTFTVPSTAVRSGTLVGKITASGKYIPYLDGAGDGSQTAAGVLYQEFAAGNAGDVKATIFVRACEVVSAKLTGADANGLSDLKTLGVIAR